MSIRLSIAFLVIGFVFSSQCFSENEASAREFEKIARQYHEQKRYDLAIENFTRAIELDPRNWKNYANRGINIYEEASRARLHSPGKEARAGEARRQANADFTRAIELHPDGGFADIAYYYRGKTDFYLGGDFSKSDYERVLADYTKAIAINPGNARYYEDRSFVHGQLDNYDKAIADARRAIELAPDSETVQELRDKIKKYQTASQEARDPGKSHGSGGTYIHNCRDGSSIVVRDGYKLHKTPDGGCITYPRDGTWHNCPDGTSVAVPPGWKVHHERDGGCFSYSP